MKHALNVSVILETTRLAFADQMPFPASVAELQRIGVERYCADLVRLEKTHYDSAGHSVVEPLPLTGAPEISERFSSDAVAAALQAIRERRVDYAQFLRKIMEAGCVQYAVYLTGCKAIYSGRQGDFHVENFPRAGLGK